MLTKQSAVLAVVAVLVGEVRGHGSMVEPPARAVMHNYGFPDNPADYNWMEGFCGGKGHQWSAAIGGRCGICGDAWDAPVKEHEAPGGKFANGVIVRQYAPGDTVTVTSHITANHVGYVEVRLCPNNNVAQDPDQDCFDRPGAALEVAGTGQTEFWIENEWGTGQFSQQFVLPAGLECEQCVLQWTYRNGRDWGTCNGACGAVETFKACADIAIIGDGSSGNSTATTTSGPAPSSSTAAPPGPTTAAPATTTSADGGAGGTCRATGPWTGNTDTDTWCEQNCLAPAPFTNCPGDVCTCEDDSVAVVPQGQGTPQQSCVATGAWAGDTAMAAWCQTNCFHNPPYCPADICNCS